jgi:hypothetical protein
MGLLHIFIVTLLLLLCSCRPPHAGEQARSSACANNLRQIGLALLEYRNQNGHFPASAVRDAQSGCLRSWRVELLPYLGFTQRYNAYKSSEAWDSKANLDFAEDRPSVFICPSDNDLMGCKCTDYLMPLPNSTANAVSSRNSVTNDESVIVVEMKSTRTTWTEPRDIRGDDLIAAVGNCLRVTISAHPGGTHVLRSNADVDFITGAAAVRRIVETTQLGNANN